MTVLESLRNRAGVLISGGASFAVVIGGMRFASGEPLIQPETDAGIVIGIVMVALYFVITDMRGGR